MQATNRSGGIGTIRKRLTKRAPDVWDASRAAFSSISQIVALSFSCSQAESTPAHTQVTQTVRLGTKADESAIQHLVKASSDTDGMVGNLAMNALIKIGKPTPSLIECVKNKSQSARLLALRAMAEIKDHCAIPVMMQVMDEESVPLQHWANEGLERLGLDMVYIKPV